jgi:uncharacterized repeat protein (TIGR02543 family)/prepilin-type N-terminal cleavage/methylation domain-containing protein
VKLNRKGYTLIELLAVILIISLIITLSIFGIIKAINSSKEKAATLSEKSIKEAAETYATEKNDDNNYWLDITDKENKYFCITIEELMNKGLLDKKANIESKDFDIHSYVLVKKNKVTMVNSKAEILTKDKAKSDDYKVCMGNIVNEEVAVYPKLDNGTSYTDEIHVRFTDATTNQSSTMSDKVCMYGDSSANIKETGVIEGNTCKLQGLKQNEKYYLRVCMKTSRESYLCSNTESRNTKVIKKPTYTLSSNTLTIKYNNANINGEAKYYFKSTVKGTSNINVNRCTLSNNIYTCDKPTTTNIEKDTWYQSSSNQITSNQINISYTTTGKAKVTARTVDKSNNYSESTKDFTINKYTITFNKGTADKIGGGTINITKSCYAISGQSCSITSPTIEKTGYTIIGWNTNKNATTSTWNINTSKSISSSATYYPILKANIYTITYNANGGSGGPSSQSYKYAPNGNIYLSSDRPSKTGYTFMGWSESPSATSASYSPGQWWGTHNANNYTLYAVWEKNQVPPTLTYTPSASRKQESGTKITLTCKDNSGTGMKEARIEDNGTVSTGVTTTSDYLNTTRSKGDITTVFTCTDNAGNVTTEKVSYAVVWCCGCCYTNKKYPRYDGSMTNNICSSIERVCNNHAKYTNCTYDHGYVTYREWSYTSC